MNPQAMMQVMSALNQFKANHPKFVAFASNVFGKGIPADTIIEIKVIKPGEEAVTSNFVVKQSDLDLVNGLKNLKA